jgi:hypothetical protein
MSGSSAARAATVVGALAVLALPAGVAAAWYLEEVSLLEGLELAVPVAFVLALVAVSLVRRARYRFDRSVQRTGGRGLWIGGVLAWTGLYAATTGAIALGFYGLLVIRG